MSRLEQMRAEAAALEAVAAARGNPIQHCAALEQVAKQHGYESWRACRAILTAAEAAADYPHKIPMRHYESKPWDSATAAIGANTPNPGTEAALRRQIEGWQMKQPAFEDLSAGMVRVTNEQRAKIQKSIDDLGALKSITFKQNEPAGSDLYLVQFEHGLTAWTINMRDGKIIGMLMQPAVIRTDIAPSPGVEAAARRNYDTLLNGAPAYELMSPTLVDATKQQLANLEQIAKDLGALKSLTFTRITPQGWDVYAVTFDNGTANWTVQPLVDGKLDGIFWTDILVPSAQAHPGTEASLRRYIESLEKEQPNYDEMTPGLADAVKRQLPDILAIIKPKGALRSIVFKGGGPCAMDVYDVTFEHGKVEWLIAALTNDGKAERRTFRPLR